MSEKMVERFNDVRDCTVSELVDWCVQRNVNPSEARITSAHVKWQSPQTDEERERYEKWLAEHEARTEKWERETLQRLQEKYGAKP